MVILVVEDNVKILSNLHDFLSLQGYVIDCAQTGLQALNLVKVNRYDLIVLDLMLPGMDGLELCKFIREDLRSDIPIIMLTARDQQEDKLIGFRHGADDYLVKPFDLNELLARVQAVLRRTQKEGVSELVVEDLHYNLETLQVIRSGKQINLTPVGLKLLEKFMRQSPGVVRREVLEQLLWGDDLPENEVLKAHIHNLRKQIDVPFERPLLHTMRGIGYRFGL